MCMTFCFVTVSRVQFTLCRTDQGGQYPYHKTDEERRARAYLFGEVLRDLGEEDVEEADALAKDALAVAVAVEPLVHLLERDILEAEDLARVVVGDEDAVHVPYPGLETRREFDEMHWTVR